MRDFIFVVVGDIGRRTIFYNALLKNGFTDRFPNDKGRKNLLVFCIYPKEKLFMVSKYYYGTCLSVEEFADLFL